MALLIQSLNHFLQECSLNFHLRIPVSRVVSRFPVELNALDICEILLQYGTAVRCVKNGRSVQEDREESSS